MWQALPAVPPAYNLVLLLVSFFTRAPRVASQLWINLLDNAIKFSPTGAEIRTAITKNGNNLNFTFEDQGKGMDEETAKHAFDKFYQGDSSHHGAGTGIGLAIAKRICELHCGEIKIKSTSEKGTVFEVILPTERN
jgi:signal transduction histidine kinase